MAIKDFIANFNNHPVLFIGSGFHLDILKILIHGTHYSAKFVKIYGVMMKNI